jgi:uncharacterized membrane protein YtjA (UPF0391 family)
VDYICDSFDHVGALGLVASYTMGGFVHILLVIAVILLVINLFQGRRI